MSTPEDTTAAAATPEDEEEVFTLPLKKPKKKNKRKVTFKPEDEGEDEGEGEGDDKSTPAAAGVGSPSAGSGAGGAADLSSTESSGTDCRYYEAKFPEVEELVVVNVRSIAEMGAYVTLLEYGNIEGMLLLSELSRRRIRSINKLIRVGKDEIVMVIRVDQEKGYIDLSKRRVSKEDRAKHEEKYIKAKVVHSIVNLTAARLGKSMEDIYARLAWPLYKSHGHAYDAFQKAAGTPGAIFEGLDLTDEEKTAALRYIRKRMAPQPVKVRALIEVSCFEYEGINAVRDALLAGKAAVSDPPVTMHLDAPPRYVLDTTCLSAAEGSAALNSVIDTVRNHIKQSRGSCVVTMEPTVTTQQDERDDDPDKEGGSDSDSDSD